MVAPMHFERVAETAHKSLGMVIDLPSDAIRMFSDYFKHLSENYKVTGILRHGAQIEIDNEG